jgi:hypothetical protein
LPGVDRPFWTVNEREGEEDYAFLVGEAVDWTTDFRTEICISAAKRSVPALQSGLEKIFLDVNLDYFAHLTVVFAEIKCFQFT